MKSACTTYWRWYRLAALFSLFSIVSDVLGSDPWKGEAAAIISFADWLPPALVGTTFTLLGSLKLYGLWKGVVGGADKPFVTRLCGT